ncbi:MAG: VWA domain-containing protein [Thermoproteota archaeon]
MLLWRGEDLMTEQLRLAVSALILVLLLFSSLIPYSAIISFAVDNVPDEVKVYLGPGEEAETAFKIQHSLPSGDSTKQGLDLVFYLVKKNGQPSWEYIVWDNLKRSVVGGYKWPQDFGYNDYKTIISYIERDRIVDFVRNLYDELRVYDELRDLEGRSYQYMKELEQEKEFWKIIAGTAVGLVVSFVTAGAALPFAFSFVATIIMAVWRINNLENLVVKWDVKPQKYPAFFLTMTMLADFKSDTGKSSEDVLGDALKNIVKNQQLIDALKELAKQSATMTAKEGVVGISLNVLAFHTATFPVWYLHTLRGILGNDNFYKIFSEQLVNRIEEFSFKSLGGEKLLKVGLNNYKSILRNFGKDVASHFRPKAVSGIPKEQIYQAVKDYKSLLDKPFSKDMLLDSFGNALLAVVSELVAEYATGSLIGIFQSNARELATNGFVHAKAATFLLKAIEETKDVLNKNHNDALKSYITAVKGYSYADYIIQNYIEFWDITEMLFQQKDLIKDLPKETLGGWFSSVCYDKNLNIPKCAEDRILKLSILYRDMTERFIDLDERFSKLTDSYLANMTKRLANAIPKAVRRADVVLTLDTSGSMGDTFMPGTTKIDILKEAAKHLINLFKTTRGNIRVGIVTFSSTANLRSDLTNDYDKLLSVISGLRHGGSTAMGDALSISLRTLLRQSEESYKAIILLTDGKSNTGSNPRDVLYNEFKRAPSSIPVFTIGIGRGLTEYDPHILKEIADKTDGTFYEVDPTKGIEESELTKIFLRIGLSLMVGGQQSGEEVVLMSQGDKVQRNIDASDGKPFAIMAMYSGSKVRLNLYTPSKDLVTPSLSTVYVSSEGVEAWIIRSPEPGIWTAELIGEVLPAPTPIFLSINKPSIEVYPEHMEVTIVQRDVQQIILKVKSISNQPTRNLRISLWGGIEQIATVEPEIIPVIPASAAYNVTLKIAPPPVEGIYDGFLEFNDGLFTQRIPVKVTYRKLELSMYTDKISYRLNENITVYVLVEDDEGRRITGADVSLLKGSTPIAKLLDDGKRPDETANDGIYSTSFKAPSKSEYMTIYAIVNKTGYPTAYTSLIVKVKGHIADIDGNGVVDLIDLTLLARAYDTKRGEERYNDAADLNGDGYVDLADLSILARYYGMSFED